MKRPAKGKGGRPSPLKESFAGPAAHRDSTGFRRGAASFAVELLDLGGILRN